VTAGPLPGDLDVARDHPVAMTIVAAADLTRALDRYRPPPDVQVAAERLRTRLVDLERRLEAVLDA
jgi:hypothetical protein